MTRKVIFPVIVAATLLWIAHAYAASPAAPAMPIVVAGVSLGTETSFVTPPDPKPKLNVAGVLQPAPMPDPDVDGPSGGVAHGPSITPALFSHKAEFAGDGFAAASDADHGLDHRRTPAAGLNWSVPVK